MLNNVLSTLKTLKSSFRVVARYEYCGALERGDRHIAIDDYRLIKKRGIVSRIIRICLLISVSSMVTYCMMYPNTVFHRLVSPYKVGGYYPSDVMDSKGYVHFTLGSKEDGLKMSIPAKFVDSHISDFVDLVSITMNYEKLSPVSGSQMNDRKRISFSVRRTKGEAQVNTLNLMSRAGHDFNILKDAGLVAKNEVGDFVFRRPSALWRSQLAALDLNGFYSFNDQERFFIFRQNSAGAHVFRCHYRCSTHIYLSERLGVKISFNVSELNNIEHIYQAIEAFLISYSNYQVEKIDG